MPASSLDSWTIADGFAYEPRMAQARLIGGVTTRISGNMKDAALRAQALQKAGVGDKLAFFLSQVHGVRIEPIEKDSFLAPSTTPLQADGWITRRRDVVMAVFIADCLPIFIWERSGIAAGVFHSGWRGTAAGMPKIAASSFHDFYGIRPQALQAAIGPHIGACCYRVGPEMKDRFKPQSLSLRDGHLYLDLAREARGQLLEEGMPEEAISISEQCTCCGGDLFYSFRRQKEDCRMMAFLSIGTGDSHGH